MNYTRTMTLTVPVELIEVANKLAKAFDPDSAGEHTFPTPQQQHYAGCSALGLLDNSTGVCDCDTYLPATVSASTPITEQLYEVAPFMLADAEALHASTLLDYETRWPDLIPPTLNEVKSFCDSVTVELI